MKTNNTSPNWHEGAPNSWTAFTYSHTLKVSLVTPSTVPRLSELPQRLRDFPPFWGWSIWDMDNRLVACGREDSLELAQASADVQATLLKVGASVA